LAGRALPRVIDLLLKLAHDVQVLAAGGGPGTPARRLHEFCLGVQAAIERLGDGMNCCVGIHAHARFNKSDPSFRTKREISRHWHRVLINHKHSAFEV